jgi:dipeptide/tripeptide permease
MNIHFFKTKYFLTCISYGILMGSSISLRVSLVFILSSIFFLSDAEKFIIYSSFTVLSDLTPILTSYFSLNFLKSQLVCLFGFFLCIIGAIIFAISLFQIKIIFFYLGLSFLSIGFGLIRANLMSINSEYLNIEFSDHKKEYGSLLYFSTVLFSFLIVFFGGFFLKTNIIYIIFIIFSLIFISLGFFIFSEKNKISLKEICFLDYKKYIQFKYIKILFVFSIFLLSGFSFYFVGQIKFFFNIPIIFFGLFYIYLFKRLKNNKDERESILFAISVSFLIVFFIMIERQRDTSIALFILRNTRYESFFLSPMQINSIFSIFMLITNLVCFKIKLHTRINLSKAFIIIPILVFISFLCLYLDCIFFVDQDGKASIFPYLISMVPASIASVLVFGRYSEVCAFAIQKIRVLIASFMAISMGFGFYLTKFIGSFMQIDIKAHSAIDSLEIYKNGFLKICIICIIFAFINIIKFFKPNTKNFLENK